jgi:[ribosomal protein S5]-alanine N-acetyltransferase
MIRRKVLKLETPRLVIKCLDEKAAPVVLDYLVRNKKFFGPWTAEVTEDFYTIRRQIEILQEKRRLKSKEQEFRFFIFKKTDKKKIIGDIAFSNIVKGAFLSCHLGYRLDEKETNKGYMEEAMKAGIKFIFDKVRLHRIEANIIPGNRPSIKLVKKLGFENEGYSKKYLKINGKWWDHFHFVKLNPKVE